MADEDRSLNGILDKLEGIANSEDEVRVRDVTATFGGRGIGPLIVLPALLGLTPLGGVPSLPTGLALIIAILASQMFLPGNGLWLPGFLGNRSVKDERVTDATEKLRGFADLIDRYFGGRLHWLTSRTGQLLASAGVIGLCALVPMTEFIPFAAFLPMGAIAVLGLAIALRDGILMILGYVLALSALGAVLMWVY